MQMGEASVVTWNGPCGTLSLAPDPLESYVSGWRHTDTRGCSVYMSYLSGVPLPREVYGRCYELPSYVVALAFLQ